MKRIAVAALTVALCVSARAEEPDTGQKPPVYNIYEHSFCSSRAVPITGGIVAQGDLTENDTRLLKAAFQARATDVSRLFRHMAEASKDKAAQKELEGQLATVIHAVLDGVKPQLEKTGAASMTYFVTTNRYNRCRQIMVMRA